MVSFQALLSPTQRETISRDDHELEINSPKKRKRVEPVEGSFGKTISDKEIHLQTPLPSEWQRCLHIKSGEIHYLNTKTQRRTIKDPRKGTEPPTNHMSLDLELNLPCRSLAQKYTKNKSIFPSSSSNHFPKTNWSSKTFFENKRTSSPELTLFPSRSELFEAEKYEDDDDKREMITAVCKKCHMLVMMCKSSPSCPNCKFMHPVDLKAPALLNQNLSLFC